MSVVQCSIVLGMKILAGCKVHYLVTVCTKVHFSDQIYARCKSYILYIMVYVQLLNTRVDLCKRFKHCTFSNT